MLNLGVNVDHVATVRQARYREFAQGMQPEPDPLSFAKIAIEAGASSITAHLREDRRHMQDADLAALKRHLSAPLNMEMAVTPEMVQIASRLRPAAVCLVPENRREVTTEGGLDVRGKKVALKRFIPLLRARKIRISLFVDPDPEIVKWSAELGADCVELHTGAFAHTSTKKARQAELRRLIHAAEAGHAVGLQIHAGHGLHYSNLSDLWTVPHLTELNIGHSIVSRALTVGARQAVQEMLDQMKGYG